MSINHKHKIKMMNYLFLILVIRAEVVIAY